MKMANESIIWNFLYDKYKNPYGVAGVMGNLFAESAFYPKATNSVKKTGKTSEEYTKAVDDGTYKNFENDGLAYGIAQWCYHTRKKGLLDLAKQTNKSVGDLGLQLEYLTSEIAKYPTVYETLLSAKTVQEASDIVMLKYEKPANTGLAAKVRRAQYGQKYFDMFIKKNNIVIKRKFADELKFKLEEQV